ncbi:hypothetical protein HMPREF1863_01429 [Aedoeadaptatus coxii]|uniref:Uncharacterized protein n=1 Tax=Aedoeadaptatus coxii TaxID=755172 RepID=A0A134AC84_9FIRM|nr:hypothetical protein HMPREF1863_01429 [Peptoniphilus coxii]
METKAPGRKKNNSSSGRTKRHRLKYVQHLPKDKTIEDKKKDFFKKL